MTGSEGSSSSHLHIALAPDLTPQSPQKRPSPPIKPSDILCQYPICDRLLSHLEIGNILSLKSVSKLLLPNIEAHLKHRWDINRRLARFLKDPKEFRSQMGTWDTLISGGFALQFFDDVLWEESDLDVYVRDGEGAVALGKYLHGQEGYRLQESEDDEAPTSHIEGHVVEAATYKRKSSGVETTIQLVITTSTPICCVMAGFFTSAVMNIITWNAAHSMFPYFTFIKRQSFILECYYVEDTQYKFHIEKYRNRGWSFLPRDENERLYRSTKPPGGNRYVGDSTTWTIPLDIDGVQPTNPTPDYVLGGCHFNVHEGSYANSGPCPDYTITCRTINPHVLRYTYTYAEKGMVKPSFWWQFLMQEIDALTRLELSKLEEHQWPGWWRGDPAQGLLGMRPEWGLMGYEDFQKPDSWSYHDHLMPMWLKAWDARAPVGEGEKLVAYGDMRPSAADVLAGGLNNLRILE